MNYKMHNSHPDLRHKASASRMLYAMGASVNSLAKDMRAIRRIAKEAILHGLCQEGMGISVK